MSKETKPYAPDFFIIGAPKCGTTALYTYLNERDDVFMPSVKEPNFYADDLNVQTQVKTQDEYNALFRSADEKQLTGEASVWHLLSKNAVKNILSINPQAKFIAMIRSPLEMFPSLHAQLVYSLWEDITDPEQAFMTKDRVDYPSFCLDRKILDYKNVCSLGAQLKRFTDIVPEDQRLILLQEDFKNDTANTYKAAIEFLGLPHDNRTDFPIINDRKEHNSSGFAKTLRTMTSAVSPLKRTLRRVFPNMSSSMLKPLYDIGSKKSESAELSAEFKNQLIKTFDQDIQITEKTIDRDLAHWRKI